MKVFKFGGASMSTSQGVKTVTSIIREFGGDRLVVVVSAIGKTTNALEELTAHYMSCEFDLMMDCYNKVKKSHFDLALELFDDAKHLVFFHLEQSFFHLLRKIEERPSKSYDFEYDRIVSTGEIVSSQILNHYLLHTGVKNQWFDARKLIITDASFRDARVDWILTSQAIKKALMPYLVPTEGSTKPGIVLTQGFLGGTTQGFSATLGREGSDYSAAILAYSLDAQEVVIWKDVAGLLNADPKHFENTQLIPNLSYQEAIELSYYGATVIHPKTLKPLNAKNIPLRVRSFLNPNQPGTLIDRTSRNDSKVPSFILKFNQMLISIFPKDFSFIAEQNLSRIFSDFAKNGVKINLMQNSALSFSVCYDFDKIKSPALIRDLQANFNIRYNTNLTLITVRHYNQADLKELLAGKKVMLEQKNRTTLQVVVKEGHN